MASPTLSIKSRELIGCESFSQRREVFKQHDTIFFPSPICLTPFEYEKAAVRGTSISAFRRTPAYSSMRETRREDIRHQIGFRERKMSDNFTSDLNQSDVDYRSSLSERTKRISKLRNDFLTSNLHDPDNAEKFNRSGTRSSLPVRSPTGSYKIPDASVYKFPFAAPFATPPPIRKYIEYSEVDGDLKDENFSKTHKRQLSLQNGDKSNSYKTLAELMMRYSPQPKPVDMTLPPTKPRVVSAVAKQISTDSLNETSKMTEKLEIVEIKLEIDENKNDDEVFEVSEKADVTKDTTEQNDIKFDEVKDTVKAFLSSQEDTQKEQTHKGLKDTSEPSVSDVQRITNGDVQTNGEKSSTKMKADDSSDESNEKDDQVPEIPKFSRQESHPKNSAIQDDSIPKLLEKITQESQEISTAQKLKKVKHKRSFLDKLLNRNKKKK